MMTFTIEELRHLEAVATPGPWETNVDEHDAPYLPVEIKAGRHRSVCTLWIDDAPVPDYNREQYSNAALIVAMRNALPELLRALEWQPIETAPKDGTEIVGLDASTGTRHVTHYNGGEWHDPDSHYYSEAPDFAPTLWLPLPPHGGVDAG